MATFAKRVFLAGGLVETSLGWGGGGWAALEAGRRMSHLVCGEQKTCVGDSG